MTQVKFTSPVAYQRGSTLDSTMSYLGSLFSFLVTGADSGGRVAIIQYQSISGNEPAPYVNEWEHEMYYVIEGEMEFYCGDRVMLARAGEVVFLPQGKAHAFSIRSPQVQALLLVQAVGEHAIGLDRFLMAMGKPVTSLNLPTAAVVELMDGSNHATNGVDIANGIHFLSPEEIATELPSYSTGATDASVRWHSLSV